MTIVPAPSRILVTGANGFIATWIVQDLIKQGYSVRGTVRSAQKGEYSAKQFGDKFEYVVVPDITKDGAFDDAVQGVDAVLHTAAPVDFSGTYESVVETALNSTVSVLKSTLEKGHSVRRVVVTSSYVTVMEPHDPGYVYTEADWNEYAIREANEKRDATPGYMLYFAGKTLAEKAAWKFVKDHESELKWDLVTILPPYVFGPIIHDTAALTTSAGSLSTSWMYDNLFTKRTAEESVKVESGFVDVRDVSRAHILALEKEKAGGERILVVGGYFAWQDILNAVSDLSLDIPKGYPEAKHPPFPRPNAAKAATILGLTDYVSLEESARDTVLSIKKH